MESHHKEHFDLLGTLDKATMSKEQIDWCDIIEKAKNDPASMAKLVDKLKEVEERREIGIRAILKPSGTYVEEDGCAGTEDITQFFRDVLALNIINSITKGEMH